MMPIFMCERCGKEAHRGEKCNYCNKRLCQACVKSSKTLGNKIVRKVICKDCWGKMDSRMAWKHDQP